MHRRKGVLIVALLLVVTCAIALKSHSDTQGTSPVPQQSRGTDFTLLAGKFKTLKVGMLVSEAEKIVGSPDFVRLQPQQRIAIYLLPGDRYGTYSFIVLTYDRVSSRLVRGTYEKPADETQQPRAKSQDEVIHSLPYAG
jgi:hypothetical protein